MNTTLGLTCSATEANASLRFDERGRAGRRRRGAVETAGALGCWAEEKLGKVKHAGDEQAGEKCESRAAGPQSVQPSVRHVVRLLRS